MRHSTFRPSARSTLTRIAVALFCALLVATGGASNADDGLRDVAIDGGLGAGVDLVEVVVQRIGLSVLAADLERVLQ